MAESGIKSNEREAARLFARGVAAARGGQRRVAVGLNLTLRDAVDRNAALARAASIAVPTPASRLPSSSPIYEAELAPARDAQVLAYLSTLDESRAHLRDAIQTYKEATSQPGGS